MRAQYGRLTTDMLGAAAAAPDPEFLRRTFRGAVDPTIPVGVSPNDAHRAMMVRAITNAAGVLSVPLSFAQMDNLVSTSTALNTTCSPGKIPHKQANLIVPKRLPKLPAIIACLPSLESDGGCHECLVLRSLPQREKEKLRKDGPAPDQRYHIDIIS